MNTELLNQYHMSTTLYFALGFSISSFVGTLLCIYFHLRHAIHTKSIYSTVKTNGKGLHKGLLLMEGFTHENIQYHKDFAEIHKKLDAIEKMAITVLYAAETIKDNTTFNNKNTNRAEGGQAKIHNYNYPANPFNPRYPYMEMNPTRE